MGISVGMVLHLLFLVKFPMRFSMYHLHAVLGKERRLDAEKTATNMLGEEYIYQWLVQDLGVQGAKPSWRGLGCPQSFPFPKRFWDCALALPRSENYESSRLDYRCCYRHHLPRPAGWH